jgi:hypothetical protein
VKTTLFLRTAWAGALSVGVLLPACGGEAPTSSGEVGVTSRAPAAQAASKRSASPTSTPRPTARSSARTQRRPQTPTGYSNLTFGAPATPTGFVSAVGDSLGIYGVSGDATSADSAASQGGPTLSNPNVVLIFWGAEWETATPGPGSTSESQVTQAVEHLLTTPYLDDMKQYGFQGATFGGAIDVTSSEPPSSFSFASVAGLVKSMIDAGTLPDPDDSWQNVYMVMMPQPANFNGPDVGAHGTAADNPDPDPDWFLCGFVEFGDIDAVTKIFSHELIESISDPSPGVDTAWTMDRGFPASQPGENEIGDACNDTWDRLDGLLVQAYFSENERACVIPFSPKPTITGISPDQGPESGGQIVTITGTNFDVLGSTKFTFGGVSVAASCSSSTTCTVKTPSGNGVEAVVAEVNHFSSSGGPTYLFGPGAPSCTATYACQHDGSGAAVLTCGADGLQGLTLRRLESGQWVVPSTVTQNDLADQFTDAYYPAPGTTISYQVTASNSFGTAVSPTIDVESLDCACTGRSVCELANGTEIYPQPNSPANWCTARGGHYATKYVCP